MEATDASYCSRRYLLKRVSLLVNYFSVCVIMGSSSLARGLSGPVVLSKDLMSYWVAHYTVGLDACVVSFMVDSHQNWLPCISRSFCTVCIFFLHECRGVLFLTSPCLFVCKY